MLATAVRMPKPPDVVVLSRPPLHRGGGGDDIMRFRVAVVVVAGSAGIPAARARGCDAAVRCARLDTDDDGENGLDIS